MLIHLKPDDLSFKAPGTSNVQFIIGDIYVYIPVLVTLTVVTTDCVGPVYPI